MKFMLPFFFTYLFSTFCFGQNTEIFPTFISPSIMHITPNFSHIHNDILYYHSQEGDYKDFKQIYHSLNYGQGERKDNSIGLIQDGNWSGKVLEIIAEKNYTIELVQFVEKEMTIKCRLGLIKRDLNDFSQIGKIFWLGENKLYNCESPPNVHLQKKEGETDAFYVVSGRQYKGEQINFVQCLSFDLDEVWKKELPYLGEDGISQKNTSICKDGSLIISIGIEDGKKFSLSSKPSKYGLVLSVFTIEGESHVIVPEIKSSIQIMDQSFDFNATKKQLSAVFINPKPNEENSKNIEGFGYSFYNWNLDGEIVNHHAKNFTLNDYLKTPYLEEYLKISGVKHNEIENKNGELITPVTARGIQIDFNNDGGAVVSTTMYDLRRGMNQVPLTPLYHSHLLFSISPTGENEWLHFIPASNDRRPNFLLMKRKNNNLLVFTSEYKVNFTEDEFIFKNFQAGVDWKNLIVAVRTINLNSGEIEEFRHVKELSIDGFKVIGGFDYRLYDKNQPNVFLFTNLGVKKNEKCWVKYTIE